MATVRIIPNPERGDDGRFARLKPWMLCRDGESNDQRWTRLFYTCCWCGTEFPTLRAVDEHEQDCPEHQHI